MEKKGKEVKLLKVPINSLIEILTDLYNKIIEFLNNLLTNLLHTKIIW